jgi:hypothetical protein
VLNSAKALVWKQFSLVFQKQLSPGEGETLIGLVMSIISVPEISASKYTVIKEQMELSSFGTKIS